MKSTELMIGDWVSWTFNDSTYPEKIMRLDYGDIRCEPIPLTEDILNDNGFVKNTLHYDDNNVVYYDEDDNHILIYSLILGQIRPKVHTYIKYVHELQHALRLCGLNVLADNFKIE